MSIRVKCQCGKSMKTADRNAGKRAKCPACGCVLTIPNAPAAQDPPTVVAREAQVQPVSEPSPRTSHSSADARPGPSAAKTAPVASVSTADAVSSSAAERQPEMPLSEGASVEPAPVGESRVDGAEPALSAQHPLFAEISVKAALAIWAVLSFLMIGFSAFRQNGLIAAVFWLLVAVVIYAVGTFLLVYGKGGWIAADTANPQEKRIHTYMTSLSQRAGLPTPSVALDDEQTEINAYTFGFSPQFARVRVTKGFMEHVMPTDEELEAVLAHELGHIKRGDFVISTLLRFPIWLMDKFRTLLHFIRAVGVAVLRVVSEVAFGWIGLLILLGLLGLLLYLSLAIAALTASIFVCAFFINLFEREREYLADDYSAQLTGRPLALQSALSKLELAARRVQEEYEKRAAVAKEGQEIDAYVAPPDKVLEGDAFVTSALSRPISFAQSLQKGEFLMTHPLTENRVYFLSHPERRTRVLSQALTRLGDRLNKVLRGTPASQSAWKNGSLALGIGLGLCVAIIPALFRHWLFFVLLAMLAVAAAATMGWFAVRRRWTGLTFVCRVSLASYACATTLLVVGPMANSRWTVAYPLVFLISLILFGACGLLVAGLLRPFQPET